MRLRSSQFVFLMLLICSVQVREDYAWHLREGVASSRSAIVSQQRDAVAKCASKLNRLCLELERLTPSMRLSASAFRLHRTAWTMTSPELVSSEIANHTGLLRS
jgi:hypothetical protein